MVLPDTQDAASAVPLHCNMDGVTTQKLRYNANAYIQRPINLADNSRGINLTVLIFTCLSLLKREHLI